MLKCERVGRVFKNNSATELTKFVNILGSQCGVLARPSLKIVWVTYYYNLFGLSPKVQLKSNIGSTIVEVSLNYPLDIDIFETP